VLQLRRLAGEQKLSAQKFELHDFGSKKRNKTGGLDVMTPSRMSD
jgi:hypothetical protein